MVICFWSLNFFAKSNYLVIFITACFTLLVVLDFVSYSTFLTICCFVDHFSFLLEQLHSLDLILFDSQLASILAITAVITTTIIVFAREFFASILRLFLEYENSRVAHSITNYSLFLLSIPLHFPLHFHPLWLPKPCSCSP